MTKLLTIILVLVVLAILGVAGPATAQTNITLGTSTNFGTVNTASPVTYGFNPGVYVQTLVATNIGTGVVVTNTTWTGTGPHSTVAVQLTLTGLGAGATNSCAVLTQTSVDGVNPVASTTLNLTGQGATTATCISNVTLNAAGYYRVYTVTSTANGTGTNLAPTVTLGTKDGF
jgi:hypothetical protein